MEQLNDGDRDGDRDGASASLTSAVDDEGALAIRVAGELDISNVDNIETAVTMLLGTEPGAVVFDLSGLTFMDSSGLAMLVRAADRSESVTVRNPSRPVKLIIEATGLDEILRIES
jgi:anti-anti-sigma factor